ncbi:MAG TPA: GNAT family N-acetyltransferase [Vicinamibacterales bacterium]|nr:GNAT family N-acetyltransferase [Vicinamibacterales bacterium]
MPIDHSKDRQEQLLDETLEETFPASDAPANTIETGIRIGMPAPPQVRDNRDASQFELDVDGQIAFLRYHRTATTLTLVHTEVPVPLRGRHLGDLLAKAGIDAARTEGLGLVVTCPFVRAYMRKHPESAR